MKLITDQDIYENLKKITMSLIKIKKSQVKRLHENFMRLDHEIKEGEIELFLLQSRLRLIKVKLGQKISPDLMEEEECLEEE